MLIHPGDTILFQGDSITDTDRDRTIAEPNLRKALGSGYAGLAAAALLADHATPDEADRLRIFNRGIGGNKVTDLAARWQDDCLAIAPDVLSILIGVNDTWHGIGKGDAGKGVAVPEYERIYRDLLDQARAANADVRLILCEPFVLRCGAVSDAWLPEMDARREVTPAAGGGIRRRVRALPERVRRGAGSRPGSVLGPRRRPPLARGAHAHGQRVARRRWKVDQTKPATDAHR